MPDRILKVLLYFHIEELKMLIGLGYSTIPHKNQANHGTNMCCEEIIPHSTALSCHSREHTDGGFRHQFY